MGPGCRAPRPASGCRGLLVLVSRGPIAGAVDGTKKGGMGVHMGVSLSGALSRDRLCRVVRGTGCRTLPACELLRVQAV